MRTLRFVAIGALIAAGIIARVSTPAAPTMSPVIESRPRAIVCDRATTCLSVGFMDSRYGVHVPFGASFAGDAWSLLTPQPPSPVVDSELSSVSCDGTGSCVAVGREEVPAPYLGARSAGDRPLIESWDGSTWLRRPGPIPPGTKEALLNGVSCVSSMCMAVGQFGRGAGRDRALALSWDGTRWSLRLPPHRRYEDDASLEDVACVSPRSCIAVGQFGFDLVEMYTAVAPLIERWDGTAWHLEASSNAKDSLDTELNGIACPTHDRCVAVGFRRHTGGTFSTFAEIRDGGRWRVLRTPDPEGSPDVELADVACPRPDRCIAVGSWVSGAHVHRLVESWDGRRWTIEQTPAPDGSTSTALSAIACPDPQTCYAVGAYERGSPTQHAFSLGWDGEGWTVVPMPDPSGPV
jgi:hypothetical protein